MSVWGPGELKVVHQGTEINPRILNHAERIEKAEGTAWKDLNDVFFNIPPKSKVVIGNNVRISMGVSITTAYHPMHPDKRHITKVKDVIIEDNVFIGLGTIIIGGVTIGQNSVVGAGAVVTRDIPPDTFAVGVPARPICNVYEWEDD